MSRYAPEVRLNAAVGIFTFEILHINLGNFCFLFMSGMGSYIRLKSVEQGNVFFIQAKSF
jgi:hypothetical protein